MELYDRVRVCGRYDKDSDDWNLVGEEGTIIETGYDNEDDLYVVKLDQRNKEYVLSDDELEYIGVSFKITLSHNEVQKRIPYQLIAETVLGSRWNTGTRKRLMKERFTPNEIRHLGELKRLAHTWALSKGVPLKGVTMTADTYRLWQKFGELCAML